MEATLNALRSDDLDFSVDSNWMVKNETPKVSFRVWIKYIKWSLMWIFIVAIAYGVGWLAYQVITHDYYKSGDEIGYNMGLIGGLMMLTLLSYPLRKHFAFMRRLGEMRYWFSMHMMFGIFGPILILFHSTFQIHSVNAGVALASMVIVATSGFIGRYAYRHIHRGLYGSKFSLHELREELLGAKDEADSKLKEYPSVIFVIHQFQLFAFKPDMSFSGKVWRFFTLPIRRQVASWRCVGIVNAKSREARNTRQLILDYLYGIERAAQFSVFERIFALWHVIHIPLVYMLVATAIWHVIAVHMY